MTGWKDSHLLTTQKNIMAYKTNKPAKTSITINQSYVGEMLEEKIDRMMHNKQPIQDPGVGLLYTERKEGVRPETDIRTDTMELALDAIDRKNKLQLAERDKRIGKEAKENMSKESKSEKPKGETPSTDTTGKNA